MIDKRGILVIVLFLVLAVSSAVVYAQTAPTDIFNQVFQPLFKGFKIHSFYTDYSNAIDFILLMILFIPLAMMAFDNIPAFKASPAGKTVAVAIGIILAFSAAYLMYGAGYNLSKFGSIAMLILVGLLAVFIFRIVHTWGGTTWGAGAIGFVIAYNSLNAIVPDVFNFILLQVPMLSAILALVNLGSIIIGGWSIFKMFGAGFQAVAGGFKAGPMLTAAGGGIRRVEESAARDIERAAGRLTGEEQQELRLDQHVLNQINTEVRTVQDEIRNITDAAERLRRLGDAMERLIQPLRNAGL